MLVIPETYKNNNEDYITLPAIKSFIKSRQNIKTKLSAPREELMDYIIQYGDESEKNAEEVLNWIDETLHEGIKDVCLQYAELSPEMALLFSKSEKTVAHLNVYLNKHLNKHICKNTYDEKMVLINATVQETNLERKIEFTYCTKLHMHDKKSMRTKAIDFPIIAEYYISHNWLLVRAKPRSNLYVYNPKGFNIETSVSTTTEKQIKEVIDSVGKILKFVNYDKSYVSMLLKNRIFNLLDKYSKTPEEISKVMENKAIDIGNIASAIKSMCSVPVTMNQDVDDDIQNIVEKYLSINWRDKEIFIKDRDAYPVKLSATDEEESKVEQMAALSEPLQTKALFFDNKKMLYKNRSCDGVVFQWKRTVSSYFPKNTFAVRILVNTKGNCIFKFTEYTSKEDIENVIFSIIGTKGNIG